MVVHNNPTHLLYHTWWLNEWPGHHIHWHNTLNTCTVLVDFGDQDHIIITHRELECYSKSEFPSLSDIFNLPSTIVSPDQIFMELKHHSLHLRYLDHTDQECPSKPLFKPLSIDLLLYSLSNIPNRPLIPISLDQVPIAISVSYTLSTLLPLLKDHSQQRTCHDHPHCSTLHSTVNHILHIPVHTTVILLPSVSYSTLNVQYMCTLVWYPVMFSCCDKLKESRSIECIQYIPMQCLCIVVTSVFLCSSSWRVRILTVNSSWKTTRTDSSNLLTHMLFPTCCS